MKEKYEFPNSSNEWMIIPLGLLSMPPLLIVFGYLSYSYLFEEEHTQEDTGYTVEQQEEVPADTQIDTAAVE